MTAQNLELKARLHDFSAAAATAQTIATSPLVELTQSDVYFNCAHGRLKLRMFDDGLAELIWYDRPDQQEACLSHYFRTTVVEPEKLRQTLQAAHRERCVVKKRRSVYLCDNVRIHLDQVDGLGEFLEFEAVVENELQLSRAPEQLSRLRELFAIDQRDLLSDSYSDMLAPRRS